MNEVSPQTHDPLLRINSNSSLGSSGVAWGLQGNLWMPVVAAGVVSLLIISLLLANSHLSIVNALLLGGSPFGVTLLVILTFFQGKKPHYAEDLYEDVVGDGCYARPFSQPLHPIVRYVESARKRTERRSST